MPANFSGEHPQTISGLPQRSTQLPKLDQVVFHRDGYSFVGLGDHHKKVLWRALAVSLVMLASGVLFGVIHMG